MSLRCQSTNAARSTPGNWNLSVNFLRSSSNWAEMSSVPIDCLLVSIEFLLWVEHDNKDATLTGSSGAKLRRTINCGSDQDKVSCAVRCARRAAIYLPVTRA